MANINISEHQKKVEQLSSILYMIERNERYLKSLIRDSQNKIFLSVYGSEYYRLKIALRSKINDRLVCYYAKKLALISSDAYELANNIIKPKPIKHGNNS